SCPERPHALLTERSGRIVRRIACAMHGLEFGLNGTRSGSRNRADRTGGERTGGADRADRADRAGLIALELQIQDGWLLVRSATGTGDAPPNLTGWPEARPPQGVRPLGVGFDADVAADWKLLVELMLEAAPLDGVAPGAADSIAWSCERGARATDWSSRRYRALAGPGADAAWHERFVLPNQLLESRPDGLSIWQAIPTAAGRSRLRRLDYTYCASEMSARAMQYLAARMCSRGRRSAIAVAESVQQAVARLAYPAAAAHPAPVGIRWFRARLTARVPALALDRPPADS
ncbi:MAG TPA: hypothetical protein VJ376_16870, partial [Pseudomonadota bacterium]|nr:hypothetical protein [Pseudomonadota bacterium]